jgi:hypothetical protein
VTARSNTRSRRRRKAYEATRRRIRDERELVLPATLAEVASELVRTGRADASNLEVPQTRRQNPTNRQTRPVS